MKTHMERVDNTPLPARSLLRRVLGWPISRLGWWSAGLSGVFMALYAMSVLVLWPAVIVVPWQRILLLLYGIIMLVCGLGAGLVGAAAALRRRERSWVVWLAILFGFLIFALLLGEFLVPH